MANPPDFKDIDDSFLRWVMDARCAADPREKVLSELGYCIYTEEPSRMGRAMKLMEQAYLAGRAEGENKSSQGVGS